LGISGPAEVVRAPWVDNSISMQRLIFRDGTPLLSVEQQQQLYSVF
jgi:hypothetical protein